MPAGVMMHPRTLQPLPMPFQSKNALPSPGLTLAPAMSLENYLDITLSGDSGRMKMKDDEVESKSSSDNQDGCSGDDQDAVHRSSKKRYHRHTQRQIQEMERLFRECPHPDEKSRLELSRELNLDPRQVKFWFQNKRTQMKAQQERHDNSHLRNENEKLKAENFALRDAIRNVVCSSCGGAANNMLEMSFDEQQLRIENATLREEVSRLSALAAKHPGRNSSSFATPTTPPSSADLGLMPPGSDLSPGPSVAEIASRPLGLTDAEKPMLVELAVSAMEELAQIAQAGEPLWVIDPQSGLEMLDNEEYAQEFPRVIGPTPAGLKIEATRETELVTMDSLSLVETLMDVDRWTEMFPSIVSRASTAEILSNGSCKTLDGAMHLMYAELQVPSPLVPTREVYFLRYCKEVDNLWVVVDVSVDSLRGNPPVSLLRCRKRPSGCVIEETSSGFSKVRSRLTGAFVIRDERSRNSCKRIVMGTCFSMQVTWVEHMEADDKGIHPCFLPLVNSGMAFGAQRWLVTLQRQCERNSRLLASSISGRDTVLPNPEGRRSMLKLAERMTNSFCAGVSASASHTWITLSGGEADDCRVVIRKSVDDPGRPPGIVLSAATSLWLPVSPARVFQFLRDERYRTEWDILSNMGVVEEMVHLPKGQDSGNTVSLLRVNAVSSNQSNMLILQECCTDKSCSLVIYAPVDIGAMGAVLNGGDPDTVLLLPSGFAILPDGQAPVLPHRRGSAHFESTSFLPGSAGIGSLLTVAFQILVDHVPTAKLSLESVATVNTLISSTVIRIKGALSCDSA